MGLHSIYGTWGTLWTEKKQKAATRAMTVKYGSRWIGKRVTDCSGLLRWALRQLGEDIVHHARYQYTECCKPKGRLVNGRREDGQPILPGTAVFLQGKEPHIHHVGVYVGHGVCIEAKGTLYGVVTSELSHWDHWGELKMIDYTDAARIDDEPVPTPTETVTYPTLRRGDKGEDVRKMQQMFHDLGYELTADGVYGAQTRSAVQYFQQCNNLTADGVCGPKTWARLTEIHDEWEREAAPDADQDDQDTAPEKDTALDAPTDTVPIDRNDVQAVAERLEALAQTLMGWLK